MAKTEKPSRIRFDLTISLFCRKHRIGNSTYHDMQNRGEGPDVIRIGRSVRITPEADDEWVQRMGAQAPDSVPEFTPEPQAQENAADKGRTDRRRSKKHRTDNRKRPDKER